MPEILKRLLGPVNIANGTSTVFTGVAAHIYTIKNIALVNNTGGSITVKLGIGGVNNADLIMPTVTIAAGESGHFDGLLVMAGAETLQAVVSATGLTITISGLDQS